MLPLAGLAEFRQLLGFLLVGHGKELVTSVRRAIQAQDFHWNGRPGVFDLLAGLVGHGANLTEEGTSNHHLTLTQCAILDQHCGHGAATTLQAGLDDHTFRRCVRRGLELKDFGLQQQCLKQVFNAVTGMGGHGDKLNITAPIFRNDFHTCQLGFDTIRVGLFLVHLVDGNNDGNAGRTSVIYGFLGLRHNAVIGGHHQDNDIGTLGAPSTHGGKGGVTRSIQEGHHALIRFHVIGTNVLGNTT